MINRFTSNEIRDLFQNKVYKDFSYLQKYENIDSFKDGYIESLFKGHDYPRIPCLLDFKEWVQKYNLTAPNKLLYTCPNDYELHYITPKEKKLIEFEYTTDENDLHKLNLNEKDFDFVLISQTLEHLYNPLLALKCIYDHIKPGGWFFTSVPTINVPHWTPFHYAGFYPIGLCMLLESVGFDVKETGQWGNHNYLKYIFKNHSWPDCEQLKVVGNGKIINEDKNVAQCWAFAQKK